MCFQHQIFVSFKESKNFQSHQRSQKFRHGAARGQVARFKELRSLFNPHREPPSFGLAFSPSSHPPSITLIALSHLASVRKACSRLRRGLLSCAVVPSRNISAMKRRTTSVTTVPEASAIRRTMHLSHHSTGGDSDAASVGPSFPDAMEDPTEEELSGAEKLEIMVEQQKRNRVFLCPKTLHHRSCGFKPSND